MPDEKPAAEQPPLPVKSPVAPSGPTVSGPVIASPATQKPKLRLVSVKKEAMGMWEPSGYHAPGCDPYPVTEERFKDVGPGVYEDHGEAPEGADHIAGDPENPTKNKPVFPAGTPGASTPLDADHK